MATKKPAAKAPVKESKAAKSPAVVQEAKSLPKPRAPEAPRPMSSTSVTAVDTLVFERDRMVAEAAYYRAQRRGFSPGAELDDWLEAEAEIGRLLGR